MTDLKHCVRPCPLCGGSPSCLDYPYTTNFNSNLYSYYRCDACKSIYVDPIPDAATFSLMYAQHEYHELFYQDDSNLTEYRISAEYLTKFLERGARVLDFGCGRGHFLTALQELGFEPFGIEFDRDAAKAASLRSHSEVVSADEFLRSSIELPFDAIHLGDVLEHLPNPSVTLSQLLNYLKPGGLLYAEGPLERNPSPVFWTRILVGKTKRLFKPGFVASHPPTHLYFTSAKQQLDFFTKISPKLKIIYWEIFETGWPYNVPGVKQHVASIAKKLGRRTFGNISFGNKFRGIFSLNT